MVYWNQVLSNNCPYKVRRFNWFKYSENEKFDYHMNNDYEMVLNPDVVVRSRGVIEKCSMCIQKIQEVKLDEEIRRKDRDNFAKQHVHQCVFKLSSLETLMIPLIKFIT